MTVSEPQVVEVEIEDLITGCTYIYKGKCTKDCENYFLSMFFGIRPHKILYSRYLNQI